MSHMRGTPRYIAKFVMRFHETGTIHKGCNFSFISLLPKVRDPILLGDYRPISLIGCLYKIIAKILAMRLKSVISSIIIELKINLKKSKLFGVGVPGNEVSALARKLVCEPSSFPFTYLGLPVGASMSRYVHWQPIIDRFSEKLSSWKAKNVSYGGRLTLVKSVLGSLPLYYFSLFRAPLKVINDKVLSSSEFGGLNIGSLKILGVGHFIHQVSSLFVSAFRAIIDSKLLGHLGSKLRWNNLVPGKINILAWRIRNYRLPTRANIDKRGIDIHSILCLDVIPLDTALNVLEMADDGDLNFGEKISSLFDVVVLCAVWWIWRARNLLVYQAVKVSNKSDVYSYGMMILEMFNDRKNNEVEADQTSEMSFPHAIYKRIELNEEQLGLHGIVSYEENDMMTTSVGNNSVFRSFFEKQKLTGPNFIDWYRQLRLVLSTEDKEYYLEHHIPVAPVAPPGQQIPPEDLAAHAAWVKGQKKVDVLMLLTMDLDIQRNLAHLGAYDMLQELKAMFSKQAEQELLQTVREFHTCKQEEGQSVSSHVLKMKGYIDNLERLGQPVGQNLAVSLILVSLNKDFTSFVQNFNMHGMGKTVNELHAMLKLHEESLPKKDANPALHATAQSW
ncbi:hypothetical protein Tco_1362093 [Tanacetum coccineum]